MPNMKCLRSGWLVCWLVHWAPWFIGTCPVQGRGVRARWSLKSLPIQIFLRFYELRKFTIQGLNPPLSAPSLTYLFQSSCWKIIQLYLWFFQCSSQIKMCQVSIEQFLKLIELKHCDWNGLGDSHLSSLSSRSSNCYLEV